MGSVGSKAQYDTTDTRSHYINIQGGEASWSFETPYKPNEPIITLHGLVIDEDKRAQGIGTELLNKVKQVSKDTGLPIELFAVPIRNSTMTMEQLIEWYKRRGFELIDNDNLMRWTPKRSKK